MTDELLDLSDIANLYRVSRRYARDVLVKSPGFTMPVLAISQKTRRWLSKLRAKAMLHWLPNAKFTGYATHNRIQRNETRNTCTAAKLL